MGEYLSPLHSAESRSSPDIGDGGHSRPCGADNLGRHRSLPLPLIYSCERDSLYFPYSFSSSAATPSGMG